MERRIIGKFTTVVGKIRKLLDQDSKVVVIEGIKLIDQQNEQGTIWYWVIYEDMLFSLI